MGSASGFLTLDCDHGGALLNGALCQKWTYLLKVVCHDVLTSPDQFATGRCCLSSARPRTAEHAADAAWRRRGVFDRPDRPADVGLLRRLPHRHLAGAVADTSHRPYPHLRLLRSAGFDRRAAARDHRQSVGVAGTATDVRRGAGHAVHGHRELAQRPGQR